MLVCVCVYIPGEVHSGISLRLMWSESVVDVLKILEIREFRDPTGQHLRAHIYRRCTIKAFRHSMFCACMCVCVSDSLVPIGLETGVCVF